ncbi:MAG: hypothetical protein ACOX3O_00105 [bacterium]
MTQVRLGSPLAMGPPSTRIFLSSALISLMVPVSLLSSSAPAAGRSPSAAAGGRTRLTVSPSRICIPKPRTPARASRETRVLALPDHRGPGHFHGALPRLPGETVPAGCRW